VATDDGDVLVGGVGTLELRDEARGADDVEGGDTEKTLGVVDTLSLEDLGRDGNGGVDLRASILYTMPRNSCTYGVRDDQDVSLGSVVCGGLGQVTDDRGVGVEQIYMAISWRNSAKATVAYHHGSCQACAAHRRGSKRSQRP
jgi:hypothetical protein